MRHVSWYTQESPSLGDGITNGTAGTAEQFPFLVKIHSWSVYDNESQYYVGAILSQEWILTSLKAIQYG